MNRQRRYQRGSVMLWVVIAGAALLGLAALATETGRAWHTKNQLQAAADSGSLAGVGNLLTNGFQTVDEPAAIASATNMVGQHTATGTTLGVAAGDVEVGSWDLVTETFAPLPGNTDPNQVRAVHVITRRDSTANGPLPTILGQAIGVSSLDVNSEAVAYWGFGGKAGPGEVDLPIAIDCCAITPGTSCPDYCSLNTPPQPNPCPWFVEGTDPPVLGGTTTCLEFGSTPEQNACWTQFDEVHPAINVPGMTDIVDNNNPYPISGNPIYLDNGTKTPIVQDIEDRFLGNKNFLGNPAGTDTDGDGVIDSWVVRLPVVECQNPGSHCAGGTQSDIVGFVCFDIHEIDVTPDKIIKGDFLCPSDPRCSNLGLGPGGTLGISAAYPVIVQ